MFTRTLSGQRSYYLFRKELVVWVEGKSDLKLFEYVLTGFAYIVKPAGGEPRCWELAHDMISKNLPYIVILDGHYGILKRREAVHPRVITLRRHSMENYLCEERAMRELVRQYCESDLEWSCSWSLHACFSSVESHLRDMIITDVARIHHNSQSHVFKEAARHFSADSQGVLECRDDGDLHSHTSAVRATLPTDACDDPKRQVAEFLLRGQIHFLLPGHFLFEIMRMVFAEIVKTLAGKKPHLDNRAFGLLLSDRAWLEPLVSDDHRSLRESLAYALQSLVAAKTGVHSH